MNRELIFRAFHKQHKLMYWFDLMWGNCRQGGGYIGMLPLGESRSQGSLILVDPDECNIIQFTGLQDCEGENIFEGDILCKLCHSEINNWASPMVYKKQNFEEVMFHKGAFRIVSTGALLNEYIMSIVHNRVEAKIMGNINYIYEND